MGRVSGQTIIVTGGGRGMGAAHVRMLCAEGAHVVIGDILEDEGREIAGSIGGSCLFVKLDVCSPEDWRNLVQVARAKFGAIHSLVNNAGITGYKTVEATSADEFRRMLDVNVMGVLHGIQAVAPALRDAGGGSIINISSTSGMIAYPSNAAYVTSKWAVRGLTKAAALDLGRDNIRVVSVHPGPIEGTRMTKNVTEVGYAHQPIRRMGRLEEV
ncbi:MAG TPA: SDR family NAD(P)-dependent oxidoreductase, partial [Rhizomicrobium sp.]|nr:SDR family NAD(P)-dependent oxidoreductase [Rhizomicrobium sp.]